MLTGIKWAQFLEGIALLCVIYYAVIGLKYYRHDVKRIIQNKSTLKQEVVAEEKLEPLDPLMPQIYDLMASIKEHLQRAAAQQFVTNETIFGLQHLIQQYPAVKASRFVPSINNEIIQLSNDLLGQPLSPDDMTAIWN